MQCSCSRQHDETFHRVITVMFINEVNEHVRRWCRFSVPGPNIDGDTSSTGGRQAADLVQQVVEERGDV